MRFLRGVLLVIVLTVVTVVVAHRPVLTAVGRFLIAQDPLEKADAIVVLSGGRGDERVAQAAELHRMGYAPRVVLSGNESFLGFPVPEILKGQALKHGVPESALFYESRSTSTAEQARYLRPMLEGLGVRRALVVTSSYHSRRTRYLFRRIFAGSPVEVRVYPVQEDRFSPVDWWTRDQDTESVVLEYIKLTLSVLRYR